MTCHCPEDRLYSYNTQAGKEIWQKKKKKEVCGGQASKEKSKGKFLKSFAGTRRAVSSLP